jgi:hypothetical protein
MIFQLVKDSSAFHKVRRIHHSTCVARPNARAGTSQQHVGQARLRTRIFISDIRHGRQSQCQKQSAYAGVGDTYWFRATRLTIPSAKGHSFQCCHLRPIAPPLRLVSIPRLSVPSFSALAFCVLTATTLIYSDWRCRRRLMRPKHPGRLSLSPVVG